MSEADVPRETSEAKARYFHVVAGDGAGVMIEVAATREGPWRPPTAEDLAAISTGELASALTIGTADAHRAFGFGDPGDWPTCALCGGSFPILIEHDGGNICGGCETEQERRLKLGEEVRRIADRMEHHVERWLRLAGLSGREARAEVGKIPERFQRDMPAKTVAAMTSGVVPVNGFGLSGTAGSGKTFTVAALIRKMAENRIAGDLPTLGRAVFRPWMAWVAWPEHVNRLRVLASRDGGVEEGDELMRRLANVEALVLDDLGAERWKAEDWVGSLLDLLVDARYKAERPTWYTTHMDAKEMQERYGTRLFSRLTSDNPMVAVVGRDLRIAKP